MSNTLESGLAKPLNSVEQAGYIDIEGERGYYVMHRAAKPVAQVLLAGHFAMERLFSYAPWMRWARYLAEHNISALRFDYRGCGESTGAFKDFTLASWLQDCRLWHAFLKEQQPEVPILVCGLGMGGLLTSHLFGEGIGAGMLLWSPSSSGSDALRDTILRQVATAMANPEPGQPRSWQDYKAKLDQGEPMQAGGYTLTPALWTEAAEMNLILPEADRSAGTDVSGRPWKVVKLGLAHVPLIPAGGIWQALNPKVHVRIRRVPLNPDLRRFYAENIEWIHSVLNSV
jgi:pimeloyl-ACP methyl ester carboxylesterase